MHYAAALNLHELVLIYVKKGIHEFDVKVKGTNHTALIIASLCDNDQTVRELMKAGASLLNDENYSDDFNSQHDRFVEMLNREFPSDARIE
jgi:ankyrin repeat protein